MRKLTRKEHHFIESIKSMLLDRDKPRTMLIAWQLWADREFRRIVRNAHKRGGR